MPDDKQMPPPHEQRPAQHVDIQEHGLDLGTVFAGVAAAASTVNAATNLWGAVKGPPSPPPEPPSAPHIELPPGVDPGRKD